MRLTIARALIGFALMAAIGLSTLIAINHIILSELKVGGPVYGRIVQSKDLIADILPPPEYVIEAYLEANLIIQDPVNLRGHAARLARLREDYDLRQAYWRQSDLPQDMKGLMTGTSDAHVQSFWRNIETRLLPAAALGDMVAARAALDAVSADYNAHRAVVDQLVVKATDYAAKQEAVAAETSRRMQALMAVAAITVFALLLVAVILLARRVATPIKAVTGYMAELAEGHYDQDVPYRRRNDEIGSMTRSIAAFKDTLVAGTYARRDAEDSRIRVEAAREVATAAEQRDNQERARVVADLAEGLKRLSSGDLTIRLNTPFSSDFETVRADFNAALVSLEQTVRTLSASGLAVGSGSNAIVQAADDLSSRTERQAANLEQTAAALDEITATVRNSADGAQQTRTAVQAARQQAEASGDIVARSIDAMRRIEQSSSSIGQIIGTIDEIAFQTNLLALNASVEAARVGDAGRGFAVVAVEVRALAQRSAGAAKEIKALVTSAADEVSKGVQLVDRAGETLQTIARQVSSIDDMIAGMAVSSAEQSTALIQVNTAVNELDRTTQQNTEMVERTTAAGHALSQEASRLDHLIRRFNITNDVSWTDDRRDATFAA